MQKTKFEIGENFLRQRFIIIHSGAGFDLLAFIDQRINDERLAAILDLAADEREGALAFLRTKHIRVDRLPPDGHFVDDRKIEVAKDRQRQRARDGRGGHHQQMRIGALAAQFRALFHAEAMLFIDHNELQILELDRASMTACVPMTILTEPSASP